MNRRRPKRPRRKRRNFVVEGKGAPVWFGKIAVRSIAIGSIGPKKPNARQKSMQRKRLRLPKKDVRRNATEPRLQKMPKINVVQRRNAVVQRLQKLLKNNAMWRGKN